MNIIMSIRITQKGIKMRFFHIIPWYAIVKAAGKDIS
jgi:hypothetical protein